MPYIVTGGAGFIGSCVVRTLNEAGIDDIIVVDNVAKTDKWMNLRNKKYREYIHKSAFLERLPKITRGGGKCCHSHGRLLLHHGAEL